MYKPYHISANNLCIFAVVALYEEIFVPLHAKTLLFTTNLPLHNEFIKKNLFDVALRPGGASGRMGPAGASVACATIGELGRKGIRFGRSKIRH